MLERKLPPSLRDHSLNNLAPSGKSRLPPERQAEEIAFLRAHKDESCFFLGPPGTSKSTFAAALMRDAIFQDQVLGDGGGFYWRVGGNRLFEQEVAYATAGDKDSVATDITVSDIVSARRRGFTPFLVLGEIDKRKMTEFSANVLFRLVNAMDEQQGQLIVT